MAVRSVLLFLGVFTGTTVNAFPSMIFPEDARGNSRIVSGWEADEGQIPFQLSLRMVNGLGAVTACGGTIIHTIWGMTAAHCTANRITIVVRAGTVNMTRPAVIFETTTYYNHPLYIEALQGTTVQPNDIGLINFERKLTFNDYIQPIRVQRSADKDRNYDGYRLTASGWGRTWTLGTSPENMNWVYLRGVTNFFCLLSFGGSSIIQDSTICASGYNVTSQSTCQGDSGGPLTVIDDDGLVTQVGVTSFVSGTGCHTDVPAGFIRPGHYHDWFTDVTSVDFDWEYDAPITIQPEQEPETETNEPEDNLY